GDVGFYAGKGDGTFQAPVNFAMGGGMMLGPGPAAVGDLNGDKKLDLVFNNLNGVTFSVMLGNGNGTFQAAKASAVPRCSSVALADVDGDTRLDAVCTNTQVASFYVLQGNGDGTMRQPLTVPARAGTYGVALTDLNLDGLPDVVVGNGVGQSTEVQL